MRNKNILKFINKIICFLLPKSVEFYLNLYLVILMLSYKVFRAGKGGFMSPLYIKIAYTNLETFLRIKVPMAFSKLQLFIQI